MSHVDTNTHADLIHEDRLDCLADAVRHVCPHARLVRHQKSYQWYGRDMRDYQGASSGVVAGMNPKEYGKCEHAIVVDGVQYEIGLVKLPGQDGYRLVYDTWGPGKGLVKAFGEGMDKLLNEYQHQVARRTVRATGHHRITNQAEADKWNSRLGLMGKDRIKFKGNPLTLCV